MCSLLAARNRLREGRGFWWAFSFGGQPGSSECQPQVNKCVIDVGTALVSPREAPSAFFRSDGHCGRGRLQLYAPRLLPPLITEDNTKSRMKRIRETNDIPEGGYASILALFSCQLCFISPCWCNCSPHTSGSWHLMPWRGRCAGDVSFCFLICMDVSTEW